MATNIELTLQLKPALDAASLNVVINALKKSLGPLGEGIKPIDAKALNAELAKVASEADKASREVDKIEQSMKRASQGGGALGKAFQFNQITQGVTTVANAFNEVLAVGNEYEATLAAVGAVTGQSGEGLTKLGDGARELAKVFGTSASDNLKSFQGILSKFGPQVADNADALKSMGDTVNTLSAASGDAADVSMAALTDTMLQLGLVSGDAARDADTMRQVADALASSAKVGAAEIPQVAQSILQAGVAAKGAKLSLEQTTAAIQVLAVGGKTGSEAGVALRNVLGLLQKQSGPGAAALKDMGTSVEELASVLTTQGLEAALTKLKDGLDKTGSTAERNAALMTLFGTENSAAAGILLDNLSLFGDFTTGIEDAVKAGTSGADGAVAQATARLGTAEAIGARLKAQVEDVFISIQQTLGSGISGVLSTVAQVAPTIATIGQIKSLLPDDAIDQLKDYVVTLLGQFIPALGTTNAATAASGATATTAGGGFRALWAAATGPVGLVIAGIALVVGGLILMYNNVEGFKKRIDGMIQFVQKFWEMAKPVFTQIGEIVGQVGALAFDAFVAPFEIATDILGAVAVAFLDLLGFGGDSAETMASMQAAMDGIGKALDYVSAAIAGIKAAFSAVTGGIKDSIGALAKGDLLGAATAFLGIGSSAGEAFNEGATKSLRESTFKDAVEGMTKGLETAVTIETKVAALDSLPQLNEQLQSLQKEASAIEVKVAAGTATDEEIKKLDQIKARAENTATKIAEIAPKAVASQRTVVDAAGNLKTVYDINTDAVGKLGEAQKAAYGKDLTAAQNDYSAKLLQTVSIYNSQKKELDEIKAKADAAAKAGDTKKAQELATKYKELKGEVEKTGAQMVDSFAKGGQAGLLTKKAIEEVAKAQGITTEEAKKQLLAKALADASAAGKTTEKDIQKIAQRFETSVEEAKRLLEQQKAQTAEAKNTALSVADITKAYNEARSANNTKFKEGLAQEQALVAEIERLAKNDPERKRLQGELAEIRKKNREVDAQNDRDEAREKKIALQYAQKESKEKSLLAELKRQYEMKEKVLVSEQKRANLAQQDQILEEKREKNIADEIVSQERLIQLAKDKRDALIASGILRVDGEVNLKLKGDERSAALDIVEDVNNELSEQELKLKELKLKASIEELKLAEAIREAELDKIRADVEKGLIPSETLVSELTIELEKVRAAYESADAKTKLELAKKEKSFQKEIDQIRKEAYDERMKAIDEEEKAASKERAENAKSLAERNAALVSAATTAAELEASVRRDELMAQLESRLEDESITEAAYQEQKLTAEAAFQKRLTAIKSREEGQRLALTNAADAAELDAQRKILERKLAEATSYGDTATAAKLQEELDAVTSTLAEKTDDVAMILDTLKGGVDETLSGLFDGNEEAMKDSMRKTLAVIAGFLEKLASAAIIELVLGSEPLKALAATFGFAAPAVLAGFTQLIGAGVGALLNPILGEILSFPTGGVFTKPTLAVVGDGARLGGSNVEYLLRQDQIAALLNEVQSQGANELTRAIGEIVGAIQTLTNGGFKISGSDLVLATNRTTATTNRRVRALPPLAA